MLDANVPLCTICAWCEGFGIMPRLFREGLSEDNITSTERTIVHQGQGTVCWRIPLSDVRARCLR